MDWAHAIVSGLVVGGSYWIVHSLGWLDDRTKAQSALILLPIIFVVVLVLNLIWPNSS